jgi:hypothetical protein
MGAVKRFQGYDDERDVSLRLLYSHPSYLPQTLQTHGARGHCAQARHRETSFESESIEKARILS